MRMATIMWLVVKNLWRRRTRSTLTVSGIAIGVAAVIALGAMAEGMNRNYGGIVRTTNDLLVSQANSYDIILSVLDEDVSSRLAALPGVASVEPGVFSFVTAGDLQLFMVFGYEPGSVAARHFRIVEGRPVNGS